MQPKVQSVERAPRLSSMSIEKLVRVRKHQPGQIPNLRRMLTARRRVQRKLGGGRTHHKAGYLMVRAPEHPRATWHGYVFEHILVMEERLGRYLDEDETVHHLNGIRDDNRPENLELWVRPQPSGIRAKDAIRWAREILKRNGG